MTKEEAIMCIKHEILINVNRKDLTGQAIGEALDMAIEALKHERTDEWCTDCKEYDTEKKCCPRFNRVIRGAMNREPSEDGTLEVKVEDATKVGRVLISDDKHRGGLYYPDEDEPKGEDLISRAEAIDALRYAQHRFTVADEAGGMGSVKWSENVIYFAAAEKVLAELPSPDRPRDGDLISREEAIEALGEEPLVWCDEEYEIAERDQWRADIEAIKSVPSADRPRPIDPTIEVDLESGVVPISACEPKGPKTIIYADRPRGEWTLLAEERPVDGYEIIATVYWPGYGDSIIAVGHIDRFDNWHLYSPTEGELIKGFEVIAWKTLPEPYCGADMRGDTK